MNKGLVPFEPPSDLVFASNAPGELFASEFSGAPVAVVSAGTSKFVSTSASVSVSASAVPRKEDDVKELDGMYVEPSKVIVSSSSSGNAEGDSTSVTGSTGANTDDSWVGDDSCVPSASGFSDSLGVESFGAEVCDTTTVGARD